MGSLPALLPTWTWARRLVTSAQRHLESAAALRLDDPEMGYAALYDAIRKSLTALLQAQGLRPTTAGGHLAVQHAVKAQFGASMGKLLRPVDRIRATRHAVEYLDEEVHIDAESVDADLSKARAIVDASLKAVGHMTVFVP